MAAKVVRVPLASSFAVSPLLTQRTVLRVVMTGVAAARAPLPAAIVKVPLSTALVLPPQTLNPQ